MDPGGANIGVASPDLFEDAANGFRGGPLRTFTLETIFVRHTVL